MVLNHKNWLSALFLTLVLVLAACGPAAPTPSEGETQGETSAPAESVETSVQAETSQVSQSEAVSTTAQQPLKVAALKGPTSMGLAKLFKDNETSGQYETSILGAPDQIVPQIVKGAVDIAAVPSNVAAVLYNKTEGQVQVLNVNTLGVLYLVGREDLPDLSALKGRTIVAAGKGAAPEYVLRYLLFENGLTDDDVTVEWKSEHAEVVAAMSEDPSLVGLLPEPFVTTAQTKLPDATSLIDLTKIWNETESAGDSALVMGVLVARKEVVASRKADVDAFLAQAKASVEAVNADPKAASQWIGELGIVPQAVAEKAIPRANLVDVEGEDMREMLSGYLTVLFEQDVKAVGGALPADDFYYVPDMK